MLNFDLHSHSRVSDGVLSPTELVERAHANGVKVLALTDHDEVGGITEAKKGGSKTWNPAGFRSGNFDNLGRNIDSYCRLECR